MSGMSELSAFPDPPSSKMTPAHMSVLNSYFDTIGSPSTEDLPTSSHLKPSIMRRATGESAAEAILAALREEDESSRTVSENAH